MRFILFLCLISASFGQLQHEAIFRTRDYQPLGLLAESTKLKIEGYLSPGDPRMHIIRDHYRYLIKDNENSILRDLNFRTSSRPQAKFSIDHTEYVAGCIAGKLIIFRPPHYENFEIQILRYQEEKRHNFWIYDTHWQPDSLVCFGYFQPTKRLRDSDRFPFISTIEIDLKGIRNHRLIWKTWHREAQTSRVPDALQHIAHRQLNGSFHVDGDNLFWIRAGLSSRLNDYPDLSCSWMKTDLKTGRTKALPSGEFQTIKQLHALTKLQISLLRDEIKKSRMTETINDYEKQIQQLQKLEL